MCALDGTVPLHELRPDGALQLRERRDGRAVLWCEALLCRRAYIHSVEEWEVLGELVELSGQERVGWEPKRRALRAKATQRLVRADRVRLAACRILQHGGDAVVNVLE